MHCLIVFSKQYIFGLGIETVSDRKRFKFTYKSSEFLKFPKNVGFLCLIYGNFFKAHIFVLVSDRRIREFGQKFIFGMTLLVIHLRCVDFLEFVSSAMFIVVALKCYPQSPNIFLLNLRNLPKLASGIPAQIN